MARTPGARSIDVQVKIAAVRLVRSGLTQAVVARAFGVDPSTVCRWWRLARTGGANALARRPVSGRPRKLAAGDIARLRILLSRPPRTYGIQAGRWTLEATKGLIHRTFGVSYHPSHVWKVLKSAHIDID